MVTHSHYARVSSDFIRDFSPTIMIDRFIDVNHYISHFHQLFLLCRALSV